MSAEEIIKGIRTARHDGVRLFICGLIHNYSLELLVNEKIIYTPHPNAKGSLTGKKAVSEDALIREILPQIILLEGYTSEERYEPGKSITKNFRKELINQRAGSPNLLEILTEVYQYHACVRGFDYSPEEDKKLRERVGIAEFKKLYQILKAIFELRLSPEFSEIAISEEEKKIIEPYCRRERNDDLTDPNYLYHACKNLPEIVNSVVAAGGASPALEAFSHILTRATTAFRTYLRERDTNCMKIVTEELQSGKIILLKIGKNHLESNLGALPSLLDEAKIPYHAFVNLEDHTKEELDTWKIFNKK